ncbi:uncharacterized protein EAE98_002286 [Botrytis deweyae]|uniref:Altered inheritance of mitochondria protein 21 n=1 Tax=Botrytis deweyae TaxID=2478750 RepID=A0ABQ7IWR3_9HELO|nr:uncharacterized protein EAE98_002286 [Botrytis deweyae]KAF7936067.1 hypothetical protein EAE98_002286 [Botrytis deweyae]
MSTATPQVPPRPNKSQEQGNTSSGAPSLGSNIPQIPPRPANRRADRSVSPARESFARSPLNDMPIQQNHGKSSLYAMNSANSSTTELEVPHRPSSVALPSIGQEGNEYAEVFGASEDLSSSPTQTRNVANDLKLHAPKPSHPESSAKQRVSAVTRTDSGQAAAYGLGRAGNDRDPSSRSLKNKSSFASNASAIERPPSSTGHEDEHGIPEIGQQVPMYPNAGDVQAPSPSPYSTPYTPGIGFHNDGSKRHHERKISGRGADIPPGSYGLHGHGIIPHDRFEKAYYEKHPELYKKETASYHGPLGEGRAEWAMSSDDLNRIVRDTASRGAGLGTSPAVMSTPSEQIGFQASEEYASRMSSPRPQSSGQQSTGYNVAHSNASQTHVDSPLKKESFPLDGSKKAEFEGALSKSLDDKSERGYESEADPEDTIHVDTPSRRSSRIFDPANESRPYSAAGGDDDELREEHGYSAPILASDEVSKENFGYELQPAVSPSFERRNIYDDLGYSSTPGSKQTSRPGSIHTPAVRATESAPVEEVHEYEPLFPDDEKLGAEEKPETAADRLKRPEVQKRKFPSQDVWEDTPNSLQYTATVSTPQLPDPDEDNEDAHKRSKETPEQAFARRQEELAERENSSTDSFLHPQKKVWSHKPHLAAETRPKNLQQRFPSRDVWEDTPDSLQLQTTVSTPQTPEVDPIMSPLDERPTTGAVVFHQEKAAAGFGLAQDEGRATTGIAMTKPSIPARPVRSNSPDKAQPVIPDRPGQKSKQDEAAPPLPLKSKPQIPARPAKPSTRESSENIPLTTVLSNSSAKSIGSDNGAPATVKPKPPVPSRPVGGKIAALQGGFLADLNSRLKLGPQAPKKEEPKPEEKVEEKEKVPLSDARKGRARGPARRAPAKSPAPVSAASQESSAVTLASSVPSTLWYIDSDEVLHVESKTDPKSEESEEVATSTTKATESSTPTLATNIAGESLHDSTEIATGAEKSASPPSAEKDIQSEQREEIKKEEILADAHANDVVPEKLSDLPPVKDDAGESITEPEAQAEAETVAEN